MSPEATLYTTAEYARAMDITERFIINNDGSSSRSRCIQNLQAVYGYRVSKALIDAMIRKGALRHTPGKCRAFKVVLERGDNWHSEYVKSHRED